LSSESLVGQQFSRLLVIAREGADGSGNSRYKCLCSCGKSKVVLGYNLTHGATKSCGCLSRDKARSRCLVRNTKTNPAVTHGMTKSPEYLSWRAMKDRCINPANRAFAYYGGRGISVCVRWAESFVSFLADMGRKPDKNYSLDRIDPNQGYFPSNCRWATKQEQVLNRRKWYVFAVNYTRLGDYEGLGLA